MQSVLQMQKERSFNRSPKSLTKEMSRSEKAKIIARRGNKHLLLSELQMNECCYDVLDIVRIFYIASEDRNAAVWLLEKTNNIDLEPQLDFSWDLY